MVGYVQNTGSSAEFPAVRDDPALRIWPLSWKAMRTFVLAYVVLTSIYVAAGFAVVEWFQPSALGEAETGVSEWAEGIRTERLTSLAEIGSGFSNTSTKILLMAALLVAIPVLWRRWHDWVFLTAALLLEVSVFGTTSVIVGRSRPPIEQLDGAPTQSFPSGHVAAAVVFYVGLAMIVHWQTPKRDLRFITAIIAVVVPSLVFASRLYLGMHYVSDMVAGAILGLLALAIARHVLRSEIDSVEEDGPGLSHTQRLAPADLA